MAGAESQVRYGDCLGSGYWGCWGLFGKSNSKTIVATNTENMRQSTITTASIVPLTPNRDAGFEDFDIDDNYYAREEIKTDYVRPSAAAASVTTVNDYTLSAQMLLIPGTAASGSGRSSERDEQESDESVDSIVDDDETLLQLNHENSSSLLQTLANSSSFSIVTTSGSPGLSLLTSAGVKGVMEDVLFIDFTSGWVYGGVPGVSTCPDAFPCMLGRRRMNGYFTQSNMLFGENAREMRHSMDISHPVHKGKIENWEDLDAVLADTITKQMAVNPSYYSLLIADSPAFTSRDRIRLTQSIFEAFSVPAFGLVSQATVASYACDFNDRAFSFVDTISGNFVPVYESYAMKVRSLEIPTVDPLRLKDNNLFSSFVEACVAECDWTIQRSLSENAVILGAPEDYMTLRNSVDASDAIPEAIQMTKVLPFAHEVSTISYWDGVCKFVVDQRRLNDTLITSHEYDEFGPSIVNRKCF
eukprot:TRINITY_DN4479_c0_g1_i4.p1 TRINITY_DN4479_c0_g1~~TRINITY_DN4479_c0_g1_i4.p1  ORF type:complete len:472 (-),score=114.02 TRINITY_DN4479_c0_g1_i4:1039-2454(-)